MDEILRNLERKEAQGDKQAAKQLAALKRRAKIKTSRRSKDSQMVTDLLGCRVKIDHEKDSHYYPGLRIGGHWKHYPYPHHNKTGIIRSISETQEGGIRIMIELDESQKLISVKDPSWLVMI